MAVLCQVDSIWSATPELRRSLGLPPVTNTPLVGDAVLPPAAGETYRRLWQRHLKGERMAELDLYSQLVLESHCVAHNLPHVILHQRRKVGHGIPDQ